MVMLGGEVFVHSVFDNLFNVQKAGEKSRHYQCMSFVNISVILMKIYLPEIEDLRKRGASKRYAGMI